MHMSFRIMVSHGICPAVVLLDRTAALLVVFGGLASRLHSGRAGSAGALPPPPRPLALVACRIFDDGHSDWCEVIAICSFDLHFSDIEQY